MATPKKNPDEMDVNQTLNPNAASTPMLGSSTLTVSRGNQRRVAIGRSTTTSEAIAQLTARRCPDITKDLDISRIEADPCGSGASGAVYRGYLHNGFKVAIKCTQISAVVKQGQRVLMTATHEMYTWSKADNNNVLKLLGIARFRDQLAMVSPWMENGDMCQYLRKHRNVDRCQLSAQIASGLAYLHSIKIVHGDLKPENVVICDQGNAKLADFGSARLQVEYSLQFSDGLKLTGGTMRFLAPEIFRLGKPSEEADVYALGMTILFAISGDKPFMNIGTQGIQHTVTVQKLTPPRPESAIPTDSDHGNILWKLLMECWRQDPEKRPKVTSALDIMRKVTQAGLRSKSSGIYSTDLLDNDDANELDSIQDLGVDDLTDRLDLSRCDPKPSFVGQNTEIYKGQLNDCSEVAIKCVIGTTSDYQRHQLVKHAAKEMHTWSKLQHEHVVPFLGLANYDDRLALVLPWMSNGNLESYLSKHPDENRYIMCIQVAKGVVYLHDEGVVHGNLTVNNVLVSASGVLKITDFGGADPDTSFFTGISVSSLDCSSTYWRAPELLGTNDGKKSYKTDIHALGMVVFQIIMAQADSTYPGPVRVILPRAVEPSQAQLMATEEAHGFMMVSLLERSWETDPVLRPDATNMHDTLETISRNQNSLANKRSIAHRIVERLTEHGIQNITEHFDSTAISSYPISSGGFGDVYQGNLSDGKGIAIKCARLYVDGSENLGKMLKDTSRELYVWSKMKHPNVLPLLGVVEFRQTLGLVSPWMSNGDIPSYIRRTPGVDRYRMCEGVAAGVAYLHASEMVHGDLKGANVLVSGDGYPLIADFGETRLREYSLSFSTTMSGPAISLRWAAPELLQGERPSYAADVYALGMVILEVITGDLPFSSKSETAVMVAVTMKRERPQRPIEYIPTDDRFGDMLWGILIRCWEHEPARRPTAHQVLQVMEQLASGVQMAKSQNRRKVYGWRSMV